MSKRVYIYIRMLFALLIVSACSTEANTNDKLAETGVAVTEQPGISTPIPTIVSSPTPIQISIDFAEEETVLLSEEDAVFIDETGHTENIVIDQPGVKFQQIFDGYMQDSISSMKIDFTSSEFSLEEGGFLGLYCRYQDSENFIGLGFFDEVDDEHGSGYVIYEMREGAIEILEFAPFLSGESFLSLSGMSGSSEINNIDGVDHRVVNLTGECVGDALTLKQNDLAVLRAYTGQIASGQAGLAFWAGSQEVEENRVMSLVEFTSLEGSLTALGSVLEEYDFSTIETSRFCEDLEHEDFDLNSMTMECADGELLLYTGRQDSGGSLPYTYGLPLLRDVLIEMDVTHQVVDGYYGVVCRASSGSGYMATLSKYNVNLLKMRHEEGRLEFEEPFGWGFSYSPYLNSLELGETYHLKMVCVGNRISVYVNDVIILDVFDEDPLGIGGFGLGLHEYEETSTLVAFDNISISAIKPEDRDLLQSETWELLPFAVFSNDYLSYESAESAPRYYYSLDENEGVWKYISLDYDGTTWNYYGPELDDQSVAVEVLSTSLHGSYGLICRGSSAGHYGTRINRNQEFALYKYDSDNGFTYFEEWTFSSLIHASEANHLQLNCRGDMISLSINGELVASATDTTWTTGSSGPTVSNSGTSGNFNFWNLVITP